MKLQYRLEISLAVEIDDANLAPPGGYSWDDWCKREHNAAMELPGVWTAGLLRNGDAIDLRILDIAPYEAAAAERSGS